MSQVAQSARPMPVVLGPLSELDVRRFIKSGAVPKVVKARGLARIFARNTTLCLAWGSLMLTSATWMRFDAWPWELLS